jgi:hypothetical protein
VKSLRIALAESHIAAIAIAILLFFFFDFLVRALWEPLPAAIMFLLTAIAVRGMPYVPKRLNLYQEFQLMEPLYFLFEAAVSFFAAWLLSRWIHGVGPFASLKRYRPELTRRTHV